jgi:hypothetical protein
VGDCTYYKYRTDILIEMETFSWTWPFILYWCNWLVDKTWFHSTTALGILYIIKMKMLNKQLGAGGTGQVRACEGMYANEIRERVDTKKNPYWRFCKTRKALSCDCTHPSGNASAWWRCTQNFQQMKCSKKSCLFQSETCFKLKNPQILLRLFPQIC